MGVISRFILTPAVSAGLCIVSVVIATDATAQGTAEPDQDRPVFELLHLWAEDVEAHALDAFATPMRAAGVAWAEQVVTTNFKGIREEYSKRLAHEAPPTASFWIGGGKTAKRMIEEGIFTTIKPKSTEEAFVHQLRPEIYDAVWLEDGLSVLPLGIHVLNFSIYSKTILDQLGEPIPQDWDAFLRVAEKAKQAGYPALSISDQTWQLRFLVGSLLAENLDADQMRELVSNGNIGQVHRDAIRNVFVRLSQLRPYIISDMRDLNWKHAVDKVTANQALMNVSGDFIAPLALGKENVLCHLPPGNRFVTWSFDSIAFTKTENPAEIKGQNLFVDIVLNPENITEYVTRKGGIPILKDADTNRLPPCAQASVQAWQDIPGHVRMDAQEWMRSLAMIASFAGEYLNAPTSDLEVLTGEVLDALAIVWQNKEFD